MNAACDAIVIGAGHNGLACAAYLGAAGLRVQVLEAREVIGGATVTEEFHPGFRNSACAYFVSLLHPRVQRELDLARHGLSIQPLTADALSLLPGDDALVMSLADDVAVAAELDRLAPGDGAAYLEFHALLEQVAGVLRSLALRTPPDLSGGWRDLAGAALQLAPARRLDAQARAFLARLFTSSVGDLLDAWFAGDAVKGAFGYLGSVGNFQSPRAAGTAYVLLHHVFGEATGTPGGWGHVRGGMGMIAQALAGACRAHGVNIRTASPVREIVVAGGRATGVVTRDGTRFDAPLVVAGLHPKILYERLLDPALLPADLMRAIAHWRSGSGTFRMNVALSELPRFTARPGEGVQPHHRASIQIAPSLDYLERAYRDALAYGWARQPVIELAIPSAMDDSLAPPGCHVASLFCQHFAPRLPDGRDWDRERDAAADAIIATVAQYSPNFERAVIARRLLSPADLEREFHLVGGDIFHGALHLDQIWMQRPAPGWAGYRTPVAGVWLCASGAHPGGGVSALPGRNAARAIVRALRGRRRATRGGSTA